MKTGESSSGDFSTNRWCLIFHDLYLYISAGANDMEHGLHGLHG